MAATTQVRLLVWTFFLSAAWHDTLLQKRSHCKLHMQSKDALAERSKAVAQGAIPKGRGFRTPQASLLVVECCICHGSQRLTSVLCDIVASLAQLVRA